MGRNNQRRKTNIEQRNFKLYKHKKQWMTACATFLLTFGATAVMNVSASANTDNINNGNSTPKNAEVVKAALTNEEQSNNAQPVNEMPADSKKQTATASTADQSTAKQTTAVKDRQEQTVATQPTESVNSSKDTNHSATVATSPVSSATHPTSSADTTQSNGEQSESTVATSQTTSGKTAETNQADNKNAETTTPKSGSTASQKAKPVTPHAASTENIAPIPYTLDGEEPPYVIAGTNLTDLASKFISNADVLAENGATFSWVGDVPTPTQEDASAGSTISGTIKVTYADGTSVEVPIESMVEPQSQLQPNTFYYVNKVGDTPDFNTADANGNDLSTILYNQNVGNSSAFSYNVVGTVDTNEIGIHWANVQVTDNNTFNSAKSDSPKVIGGPYVVQIPYVVQGLKLRDDIPVDASGNPIINAQLATMPESTTATPTTPRLAFDPTGNANGVPNTGLWGQYFYQDYALAYALGIKISASNWTAPTDLVNTKTNQSVHDDF